MKRTRTFTTTNLVSAGCHINDVMKTGVLTAVEMHVSAGCHINDVMKICKTVSVCKPVSAGCHINDVMKQLST